MTFVRTIAVTIVAGLLMSLPSIAVDTESGANATPSTKPLLISLEESISPLVEHFNAHADKPRVVAILSPT